MKIPQTKYLSTVRTWITKTAKSGRALLLRLTSLISIWLKRRKSKIIDWFKKNGQNLAITAPVLIFMYLVPYTFMLGNREKTIVGIILQILAGAILVFDQIASNARIRRGLSKLIQKPLWFSLLITVIIFPFAISILSSFQEITSSRWSNALGITFLMSISFVMFVTSLTLLRKIKWIKRKENVPIKSDKFDVSDLSLRNVGILLGASIFLLILTVYLTFWLSHYKELWIQLIWFSVLASYAFTLFPVLLISPFYFLAYLFTKLAIYVRTRENIASWFWLILFVFWIWGGLLLIVKELH
jgi:hypothetical protein